MLSIKNKQFSQSLKDVLTPDKVLENPEEQVESNDITENKASNDFFSFNQMLNQ